MVDLTPKTYTKNEISVAFNVWLCDYVADRLDKLTGDERGILYESLTNEFLGMLGENVEPKKNDNRD